MSITQQSSGRIRATAFFAPSRFTVVYGGLRWVYGAKMAILRKVTVFTVIFAYTLLIAIIAYVIAVKKHKNTKNILYSIFTVNP